MFKELKVEEIENQEKSRNERIQNDKAHLEIIKLKFQDTEVQQT